MAKELISHRKRESPYPGSECWFGVGRFQQTERGQTIESRRDKSNGETPRCIGSTSTRMWTVE